jgi:hypothetical protein
LERIDDNLLSMSSNLHACSMKQSRRNIFKQNHRLLKISSKKGRPLGLLKLLSQQGIDNKRHGRDKEWY